MFQSLFSWMSLWNAREPVAGGVADGFNPCFRGCRSGTKSENGRGLKHGGVSILVFVDVALEHDAIAEQTSGVPGGFNPCYRGCRSGTSAMEMVNSPYLGFNPCFRGCRSGTAGRDDLPDLVSGFNPCFRGCRSGTPAHLDSDVPDDEFQSLFSWMSLWNSGGASGAPALMICFNPCFRGCRSGT